MDKDIAKVRIIVEHAIGGFKRWRVANDKFRSWDSDLRDLVIQIACGLHNFRLTYTEIPIKNYFT